MLPRLIEATGSEFVIRVPLFALSVLDVLSAKSRVSRVAGETIFVTPVAMLILLRVVKRRLSAF